MNTDDLRTRIAAVLNSFPADMRPVEIVNLEKADAIIRELKLEAEDGECGYCQAQLPGCRYSTWVDDE